MTHCTRLLFAAALALVALRADAQGIASAAFETPVDRYGHFALGRPHEYARVMALTDTGHRLVFELADHEVFEDLTPRVVTLVAGEPAEILAIVSSRAGGARMVLLRSNGARLEISAQSEPIGTPMRWLNPVAVADLDGDGRAEVAAVITPHLGGTLKVYRRQGAQLLEVAALGGFSNHQYGTPELALSGPFPVGGSTRLLVPDTTRLQLRIVGLENGRLVEVGRCALDSPVTGAIRVVSATEVSLGLRAGRRVMAPDRCAR